MKPLLVVVLTSFVYLAVNPASSKRLPPAAPSEDPNPKVAPLALEARISAHLKDRELLTRLLIERIEDPTSTSPERTSSIESLGRLGGSNAVAWLVAHERLVIPNRAYTTRAREILDMKPCFLALRRMAHENTISLVLEALEQPHTESELQSYSNLLYHEFGGVRSMRAFMESELLRLKVSPSADTKRRNLEWIVKLHAHTSDPWER